MTIVHAANITRLLRSDAERGKLEAQSVIDLANAYIAVASSAEPDRVQVRALHKQASATQNEGWPFLREVREMIEALDYTLNVRPFLPRTREVDVAPGDNAPRYTIGLPIRGEGRFVRQQHGPGKFGHIVLSVESKQGDQRLRLAWELADATVPTDYMQATFNGIQDAAEKRLPNGGFLAALHITVIDGTYHPVDSSELSFRIAGMLAMNDALTRAVFQAR